MNKISTKHLMLFFIGVTFISIKTYPSFFINLGGRDTWICTIIATILFMIFISYLIHIMKKHETYDISRIFQIGLSKPLGYCALILFGINLFLSSIESASVQANVIQSLYFLDTPIWYILAFFLVPAVILLNKNIRTLLVFTVVAVSSLVINAVAFALLIEKYKDIEYIMPVLSNGIDKNFILCIGMIFCSLCSILIAVPFMKFLNNGEHLNKHSFITNSGMSLFIIFVVLGVISYFGPERASNIFYAEAVQGQRVEIGGFLEFGELFFIYQTVVGFLIKYVLSTYGLMILFKKFSDNKFLFILINTFLTFVFSNLIATNNYYITDILNIYIFSSGILFFILPLISFISFNIKQNKKKSKKVV